MAHKQLKCRLRRLSLLSEHLWHRPPVPNPHPDPFLPAQDTPVEDRLEFLLEGNLWQHCSKPERERFKQEILLRPALDVQAKKELCGKLGIDISAEELQYRISRTSTQDEHKRQVSLPILIYACRAWGHGGHRSSPDYLDSCAPSSGSLEGT